VLLVEDNDDLRRLFSRVLRLNGCEACGAAGGAEALEVAVGFAPELVLTDLMMPGMDGVELIRRLHAIPELAAVPIVAITADTTPEAERRARQAGAIDFVVKPVDIGLLLARMGSIQGGDAPGGPARG
jgi:CheY-like chemotaxis protein